MVNGERISEKLAILADAAKYDVSCASSGSNRKNENKGLGTTGNGICHAYTEDGRCVSLLKILLTNHCIYDCAYCVSRKRNDIKRAAFTVQEVVDLTINFYRRNYIEGLFLSSGIFFKRRLHHGAAGADSKKVTHRTPVQWLYSFENHTRGQR